MSRDARVAAPELIHEHGAASVLAPVTPRVDGGTNAPRTCRVLFAGGCHINGYLVGSRHSFSVLTASELTGRGITCEIQAVAPLPLSHPERIRDRLQEFAADALVLQVGHWETVVGMRNYVRLLAGVKQKRYPEWTMCDEGSDLHLARDVSWRVRMAAKVVVDCLLGRRVIDLPAVQKRLACFMEAVALLGLPRVIVLSPFPCADPVIRHYRKRLATEMRRLARKHAFEYIDFLESAHRRQDLWRACAEPYADPIHLSREGHRWIAAILAAALAAPVDQKSSSR